MKKLILAALALLIAAPAAFGQIYVKTKIHTGALAVMGQSIPAKDEVTDTWISADAFATGGGDVMIVDVAKKMMFMVKHGDKSYVETPLPIDFAKMLPPEAAPMAAMLQMTATVTPTTQTKKIGTWNCTGYDVAGTSMGMQISLRIWTSMDVPFDVASFNARIMPAVLQGQMHIAPASIAEFAKIKGYQIASEMNAESIGAKMLVTQEVVEISQKTAPAGTFAPPAGYKKNATLSLADLQKK